MNTETPAPEADAGIPPPGRFGIVARVLTAAYFIAAAALLIWGASRRFHLPQAPIIDPDIEGYLGPAISALAGKPFLHLIGRSFPYPGFVYLILRIFGDFRAISIVQHILGIAAGGIILLAWNAAAALLPPGGIPRPLVRFIGLAPAYVYLGSATAISFEHQIRPEAVFPFLAILNIWLSFLFLDARFIRPRPSSLWLGAVNVFVAFLMYMAKPSFGFATVFSTSPVWLSLLLPGASIRAKAMLAAAAILPAALLLFLPEHILKAKDPWRGLFLAETLITVHAPLVERQMTEDLAANTPLPWPRATVQAAHDLLAAELVKAAQVVTPKAYPSLGFNPDYLMYGDSFCYNFQVQMRFTPDQMADFCMGWYRRALLHHPGAMIRKAGGQLALFYAGRNPAFWPGRSMDLSGAQYSRAARLMVETSQLGPGNPAVARYVETTKVLAGKGIVITQSGRFTDWLHFFANQYRALLGVALLSPALLFSRPLRQRFLWLVVALWLAYSYNFGNCLTIAVVHSLEVNRYVRIQLIFTIFSECLSIYLLLELAALGIRAAVARRRPSAQTL